MYGAFGRLARSLLGLPTDGNAPRAIAARACRKAARIFSRFATAHLIKLSARERHLEWSRDAFYSFLKNEFAEEIGRCKAAPLLPTTPDGKVAAPAEMPRTIWTLWWQGNEELSNLPRAAKVCLKTMRGQKGLSTFVITRRNVADYIDISDVLPLYDEGRIRVQFLSDVIRARLLSKYGGAWCDMGILFLDPSYLSEVAESCPFFSNKKQGRPLRYLSHGLWSTYFWLTFPDNPVMAFVDEVMTKFCLKYGTNFLYFLMDCSLMLGYREVPAARRLTDSVPCNNPDILWLNGHWAEKAEKWLAATSAQVGA